jgi:hypothetical protein
LKNNKLIAVSVLSAVVIGGIATLFVTVHQFANLFRGKQSREGEILLAQFTVNSIDSHFD